MGEWTKGKLKPRGRFVDAAGTVDTWDGVVFSGIITCHETRETDGDGRVWTASGNPEANAERIVACWNAMLNVKDPAATMKEVREVLEVARADAVRERDGLIETEAVWTVSDEDGVQYPKMETLPADAREELALISEKVERVDALLSKLGGE